MNLFKIGGIQQLQIKFLVLVSRVKVGKQNLKYLFDKKPDLDSRHWKEALELEEYRHVLKLDIERSGCENVD